MANHTSTCVSDIESIDSHSLVSTAVNLLGLEQHIPVVMSNDEQEPVMIEPQKVLQLQIRQDNGTNELDQNHADTQVIEVLVYHDIVNCGMCGKQSVDMVEFLEHKSQHTIGNSVYRCDLCKAIFLEHSMVVDHYVKFHKIPNFGSSLNLHHQHKTKHRYHRIVKESSGMQECDREESPLDENKTELNGTLDQLGNNEPDMGNTLNEDCMQENILDKQTTDVSHVLMNQSLGGSTVVGQPVKTVTVDLVPNIPPPKEYMVTKKNMETKSRQPQASEKPDFHFILLTETIRGNSFSYGKSKFQCLHCEFKTHSKLSITKHMNEKHRDMLDLHQVMDIKEEIQGSDKRKVMKMSTFEKTHPQRSLLRSQSRFRKIEKRDLPGTYTCDQCNKTFTRLRYLRKHKETHRTEKKYLCDECGKSFKSRTYLTVHRRIHKEKIFKCNQCDFKSTVNAAIHAHRQVHNQGSVLCDTCGFAYTDKSTLAKHKRVHDLSRPYACNFPGCTWRFKTDIMCKAHIRAHTTEGKFKCSFCGYVFRHKHHLQRHESKVHEIKHDKTKSQSLVPPETYSEEIIETVNLVVKSEAQAEQLQLATNSIGQSHLVVGGESYQLSPNAYVSLIQNNDPSGNEEVQDTQTILMSQEEADIVFSQD